MKAKSVSLPDLAVEKSGEGTESILLFHGYGQSIEAFNEILPGIPFGFTRFHFHLPAHGASADLAERPFDKKSLHAFFLRWFKENGVGQFSVAGYSLGGKLALLLAEFFPERIHKIILIAPDGIKPDVANLLLNRNLLGRLTMRFLHRHPFIIRSSLQLARRSGIMHEKVFQYFIEQTANARNREFAMRTWKAFRKLRPDLHKITSVLSDRMHGRILIVYGRSDKLVPSVYLLRFAARIRGPILREFPGGHQLLNASLVPVLHEFLSEEPGK